MRRLFYAFKAPCKYHVKIARQMMYNQNPKGVSVMSDRKKRSLIWKIPVFTVLAAIIIAGTYVACVFIAYSRIEDMQNLETDDGTSAMPKRGEEYTAVSYNVGFGAYTADYTFFMDEGKESRARSRESVVNCITGCAENALSFDPDIALFQEVDTDSDRSWHVEQRDMINEIFRQHGSYDNVFACNYHSSYLMYPPLDPIGASNSGILAESKFDIASSVRRSLPVADGFSKILDLDRCYTISRIPVEGGGTLALFNLHLSAYGTDADLGNAQLAMLFDDMAKEYAAGSYVLVGGDFNHDFPVTSKEYFNPGTDRSFAWCEPFPDDMLPDGFRKCTDYDGAMIATTRYTDIPYGPDSFTVILDGFIVSDNITVKSVSNIDFGYEYTDHNPVVLKFVLN